MARLFLLSRTSRLLLTPGRLQILSFLAGYMLQDIKLAVYVGLAGTALTFLVIVPPWPFFNQHPVKWLPVGGGLRATVTDEKARG
jgi:signal peptidase complex subunit 1